MAGSKQMKNEWGRWREIMDFPQSETVESEEWIGLFTLITNRFESHCTWSILLTVASQLEIL